MDDAKKIINKKFFKDMALWVILQTLAIGLIVFGIFVFDINSIPAFVAITFGVIWAFSALVMEISVVVNYIGSRVYINNLFSDETPAEEPVA